MLSSTSSPILVLLEPELATFDCCVCICGSDGFLCSIFAVSLIAFRQMFWSLAEACSASPRSDLSWLPGAQRSGIVVFKQELLEGGIQVGMLLDQSSPLATGLRSGLNAPLGIAFASSIGVPGVSVLASARGSLQGIWLIGIENA
ncbi:hypothetical protein [Synechococcus sp. CS-1328]|uniref:hypothetical protein n=1 Tax=Synechococcus sp. CS-1328 TaxID=2847976 RepID=UPI0028803EDD|nr:hypothetical protein [Synechococcus sp. CS-1328]MCT0226241.1 hypothetical protein [Synechococcus sp. CS-1328]